ncbi:YheC/YheD family protein [Paenibacillus elgii]
MNQWIPETVTFTPANFQVMLKKYTLLFMKPSNGMKGSSIVRITAKNKRFVVWARSRSYGLIHAELLNEESMTAWLKAWKNRQKIRKGRFILQQGLNLELLPNRFSDVRILIQKDGKGEWQITGMGIRVGEPKSPNSNLNGNARGKTFPFDLFMKKRFGNEKAVFIRQECEKLAHEVVKVIEKRYGSMMEFGLDVGVDVNGHVWLIEANLKPGRTLFTKMGAYKVYRDSVRRPLQYAMYLSKTQGMRLKRHEDLVCSSGIGKQIKAEV